MKGFLTFCGIVCGIVILYFAIGFGWGNVAWKEFRNDTPSENLSLIGKSKRLVLFPITYHLWENNFEIRKAQVNSCFNSETKQFTRCTGNLVANYNQVEYGRFTMLLWPFNRLFPALIGIPQIVVGGLWLAMEKIYANFSLVLIFGLSIILWLVVRKDVKRSAKYLRKAKAKLFLSPADLSLQVMELEEFLSNLEKQQKSLIEKKEGLGIKMLRLESNLKEWKSMPKGTEQVVNIVSGLSQEIDGAGRESEILGNKIVALAKNKSEIKEKMAILTRCKNTMALGVKIYDASGGELIKRDSVAVLACTSITSANSLKAECQKLLA